jgi:alpha/beta superfamily hydrolase
MEKRHANFLLGLEKVATGGFTSGTLRWLFLVIICALVISGCRSPELTASPTKIVELEAGEIKATPIAAQTNTPLPTKTPLPTDTPVLTDTPLPTDSPVPTDTEVPSPTPTALPEGVELVKLRTSDGIDLVGFLHLPENQQDEGLVVVLAHGHSQSHTEWQSFEELMIENGIATMTFDFRGHGSSGGTDQFASIGIDVKTVFDYVERRGFERVICIGSSSGGSACLAAAVDSDIEGLVMLSSVMNLPMGSRLVSTKDFKSLAIPKIFMFTEEDIWAPYNIEGYYETAETAEQPKNTYIYPGIAHGTGLFYEEYGEEVLEILLDFVKDLSN